MLDEKPGNDVEFLIDKLTSSLSVPLPTYMSFPPHHGSVLNTLSPVTAEEVRKLLSSSPPKSSNMDIIPTSLISK